MPSRKDSPAKRRRQLLSSLTPTRKTDISRRQFLGDGPPSGNSFDNPHLWDTLARSALKLDGDDFITATLRAAFDGFKLDPVDPFSWRILISCLAYLEFGKRPRRKAGAPKKWTKERLAALRAAMKLIQAGNADMSDTEIARRLARDPQFGAKSSRAAGGREGLRRTIRKARRDLP
jgi:hypothetical protein